MTWEYAIANKIKGDRDRTGETAIAEASGSIGFIEQLSPLKISVGEVLYDEDEMLLSDIMQWRLGEKTFQVYIELPEVSGNATMAVRGVDKIKAGDSVIVVPIESASQIAVIDKTEDE